MAKNEIFKAGTTSIKRFFTLPIEDYLLSGILIAGVMLFCSKYRNGLESPDDIYNKPLSSNVLLFNFIIWSIPSAMILSVILNKRNVISLAARFLLLVYILWLIFANIDVSSFKEVRNSGYYLGLIYVFFHIIINSFANILHFKRPIFTKQGILESLIIFFILTFIPLLFV